MLSEQKMRFVTIVATAITIVIAALVVTERAQTARFYVYGLDPASGIGRSCIDPVVGPVKILDCGQNRMTTNGGQNSVRPPEVAVASM